MTPETITIGIACLIVLYVIITYNAIVACANAVQRAWASVLTYERQLLKLIPRLEETVASFKVYESGLQTKLTELRSAVARLDAGKIDTPALGSAQAQMRAVMDGIRVAVEAYPDLRSAELAQTLMKEMAMNHENVSAAVVIFNGEVERHNGKIESFPSNLVNGVLNRRQRVTPFSDEAAGASFEYRPSL